MMMRKFFAVLSVCVLCSIANAGQEMPQQMWWDIYQSYTYLSNGPQNQLEQRRQKWADMNDAQRDAATPQSLRQKWYNMSMGQRQQASQDAWSWMQAHQ